MESRVPNVPRDTLSQRKPAAESAKVAETMVDPSGARPARVSRIAEVSLTAAKRGLEHADSRTSASQPDRRTVNVGLSSRGCLTVGALAAAVDPPTAQS